MATDFIMPRLPDHQPPHALYYPPQAPQSQLHGSQTQSVQSVTIQHDQPTTSSQQISPLSTSNNTSPTSPKSYHGRQLRPLYMPAVLRPTQHTSKKCPIKKSEGDENGQLRLTTSFISLSGLGALGRLSRRPTGDSGKCSDGDWNLDMFPQPTATPTREHWKPDHESSICDEPSCMRGFNYWTRRHHCRRCGNIFCDSHTAFDVPLDQDANYNPKGTISRACNHCYAEFKSWRSRTNSQASSEDGSVVLNSQTAPSSPLVSSPTAVGGVKNRKLHAEVAASVPRDWNWSTF